MQFKSYCATILLGISLFSCTDLDEQLNSDLEETSTGNINPAGLLISAYSSLNNPYQQDNRWCLQQLSSDEAVAPTRGGDWDDNGTHRAIHLHTWNADNSYMSNTFGGLLTAIFQSSNVLRYSPSAQQAAEARFIRALAMFDVLDLWGVVPYRENLDDFRELPKTLSSQEATDFIISEVNAIMKDLPDSGAAFVANKNAARVLLMKVYLNKGTFLNRQAPTFAAADMAKVVSLANEITGYTISPKGKYFDNFAPDNHLKSTENIFTLYNEEGVRGGGVDRAYWTVSHYNMTPGGWNGWAALSNLYDKFGATDERRGGYYDYSADTTSNHNKGYKIQNAGFLQGQQISWVTNKPLMAKNPATQPLVFTKEVTIRTSGATLETAGIRVIKYPFDFASKGQKNNDWVVYRYSDVLLMKAEAILRGGTPGTAADALTIVNSIRTNRGAANLTALTLDVLLDERSRELYWEGWRRQDLIRFGKFLLAGQIRPADTDPKTLVYAIPSQQIAVNANLKQNPGY
ncbi:RagB/SusD family nutrient uptake outer membrane protein [Dyadobacter psychrotolerans]|uniref:RagB/SusD family nutrient uptake outer membrane protein n=1 Tax=Dyadobacter psychrotolerans TaxID=2541721 RepID=A0A4R5DQ80_9BACT|nr:RagB/SusD family nutrient uptake outer membrane protein [Dyadobacter psychrotolerans]TDE13155.1 RagB/SusD family nutrient uptake outer membrane protein [Dyadobacter psychrotolerans]